MYLVVKAVPRIAIFFYVLGFSALTLLLIIYFNFPDWLSTVVYQQCFIGAAITVVIGSVINTIYQFRSSNKNDKE